MNIFNTDPNRLTESERWRLLLAAGGVCEICGGEFELGRMRVLQFEGDFRDRQGGILIICEGCLRDLQRIHVPLHIQRQIVAERPFGVRQLFRKILGEGSTAISLKDPDLEEMYRIACDSWSLNGSG
ncbi:MAG: hypothetical protein QHG99_01435 [Methanomicrobiales archaeon]|nr:hypothetical protein [Methanomicrobiales archaeon]